MKKRHLMMNIIYIFLLATISLQSNCSKNNGGTTTPPDITPPPVTPPSNNISMWVTRANQITLLQQLSSLTAYGNPGTITNTIEVDSTQQYQSIDGFGFTLTGGSASVINKMDAASKSTLLNNLFGNGTDAIGISYLRVSIGASDLSASVFSYDDMPVGQTDATLANFNLSQDTVDVIPVLKQILAINPNIKILGSPWSPPTWMKDNGSSIGGSLLTQYYNVYSKYFVKYIQAMKANGINIDAVTIQNEPQYGGNNPSMLMSATQEADFVKNNLGPAFQAAALSTKIIVWDHNCDNPTYPITVLSDAAASPYIAGSAFHLYGGDISALSTVHNRFPDKNVYFTEQWTSSTGSFDGDLNWHLRNVIIGSMKNWSKVALEWNLANDPSFGPHTNGGCTQCKGAVTISGSTAVKNVGYYIVGQASKFIPAGSTRISSTDISGVTNVAFLRPDGKKVLIVLNDGAADASFNIKFNNKTNATLLPAGSVATFIW